MNRLDHHQRRPQSMPVEWSQLGWILDIQFDPGFNAVFGERSADPELHIRRMANRSSARRFRHRSIGSRNEICLGAKAVPVARSVISLVEIPVPQRNFTKI